MPMGNFILNIVRYTFRNPARDLLGILLARKIKARTAERRWRRNSV